MNLTMQEGRSSKSIGLPGKSTMLDNLCNSPYNPPLAVQVLRQNPWPPASRRLRHPAIGEYRLRVGDWRVFYDVDQESKAVVILRVMHRREAYRSR